LTTTLCAEFQFEVVKLKLSVFEVEPFTLKIVPSPRSVLANVKVTLAVGALLRRTVKF
jgi:Ni,Fe-hydrogenase III small subunit